MAPTNSFSAADSAIGYLYQVRVGLLWSIRRLRVGNEFQVSIETLDDVTFEDKQGAPLELLQTKHHKNREASLTDASPDLWKTLRIWFEGRTGGQIPAGTALHLLTTGVASAGSAASHLRVAERNVDAALNLLEITAQSSDSVANAPAYQVFSKTPRSERRQLLESVTVLDRAPDTTDLNDALRQEVFWAVGRDHLDAFLDRLEGWWVRRVVAQLAAIASADRILSAEVEAEMSLLREQFKEESLPIDDDLLAFELDETTRANHAGSNFVRQLELVEAGKKRIAAAIRDYYRAFEQRSRWLRDELLLVGDLSRYERRLVQEWELVFEAMKDDIGDVAAEDAKKRAARDVLKWAERATISIRANVTEPFITRGSLHMLADGFQVGWHPNFRDRLANVLGAEGPGAA